MTKSTFKTKGWVTHVVTLLAGVLAAFAAVYFSQIIRTSTDLEVGIVSVEKFSPSPAPIYLTSNELLNLDNSTTEIHLELSGLYRTVSLDFLESLKNHDPSNPLETFSSQTAMQQFEKEQPVSVDLLESVLTAIEENPSPGITGGALTDYADRIENLPIETAVGFSNSLDEMLENDMTFHAAYKTSHEGERAALAVMVSGKAPEDLSELFEIKQELLDTAKQLDTFSMSSQSELMSTKNKVIRLIHDAQEEIDGGSRLEFRVVLSNNGQVPLAISRFGVLEIDGNFLVPIQRNAVAENVLVLPESAVEVVFSTLSKSADLGVWSEMIQHGVRRSNIVCRLLVQPDLSVVRSDEIEFFNVLDAQKYAVENLLNEGERLAVDIKS